MITEGEWTRFEADDPATLTHWRAWRICTRCGATVMQLAAELHADWHSAND